MPRAELRAQLRQALAEWGVEAAALEGDTQSLIRSGALDSGALFNLSLWVEEQLGHPVDPNTLNVLEAWDSIAAVVAFVEGTIARDSGATPSYVAPAQAGAQFEALGNWAPAYAGATALTAPASSDYQIERYQEGDINAIAQLFTQLWSPDLALNRQVFEWKYLRNPLARDALIYLVRHQGQVVAMRALCETQWQAQGADAPVTLYCADDLIIDPAHRNHGLYALLNAQAVRDLAQRGHSTFISLSALRVARLQSLAAGAQSVLIGPVLGVRSARARLADALSQTLERVPGLWRAAQALSQCVAGPHQAAAAFARLDAARDAASGIHITAQAPYERMAALVARAPHDGRIRHLRDAAFLRWRLSAPLHEYRVIYAEREGALTAYVVLGRARSSMANAQRVNLVDWAATDNTALNEVLQTALHIGRFAELATWGDADHSVWQQALIAHGFAPIDQHQSARGLPCVLVHAVDAVDAKAAQMHMGTRSLTAQADWDLHMLYTSYA